MNEPNAAPARIVVIEDELPIRRFLRAALPQQGFQLIECETAKEGLLQITSQPPDVVILDLGLPDTDGMEVLRQVREWSTVPVLVLSARGQEHDKVAALDAGADDYLTKPFGIGELTARIRAALRRSAATAADSATSVFESRGLKVDFGRRLVHMENVEVHLTPIEYKLLTTLVKYAGKVVTHKQLLKEVWGPHATTETHYLRVYMGHLRHKVEAEPARPKILLTEPGVGYRLAVD